MGYKIFFVVLGLVVAQRGRGQALGGFFEQGATELKEYAEQIAALKVYEGKLKQGYAIVKSGLKGIGNIHGMEYSLHQAYFGNLTAVNPTIAGMAEVGEIIRLQVLVGTSGKDDLRALSDVLTPGKLTMTDNERMDRILRLDADMKARYVYLITH